MKLNLEIELDWIDEEKGLDGTVKNEIIEGITRKINKKISEDVVKRVNDIIDKRIIELIDQKTSELYTEFLNRPVTLTDSYGSRIKVYDNVESLVKEKFDNFMTELVDKNGKLSDGYGTKLKRIEFIIDNQLKTFAEAFTKDAVAKVSKEIKEHVAEGLSTKLGAELMQVLKVDEMLKLNPKR